MKGSIQYLSRKEIDTSKWDERIRSASNGRIYSFSFYLDTMADEWDALVLEGYEQVMPLPWRKKLGTKYIYQPFLTAELGVFGEGLTPEVVNKFTENIPSNFRLVEISLNSANLGARYCAQRNNFTLSLNPSYQELFARYRENARRNIRKAYQAGCTSESGFDESEVIELAWQQVRSHKKQASDNLVKFKSLFSILKQKNQATTYGIRDPEGLLIASCILFYSHGRAYYILVGNHQKGRTIGASHALIDALIKDHAGKNMILDFEGSDIQSLAFFYNSFGAENEPYPFLQINRLPFWLKWAK
jgi:hypothetical protein